MYKNQLQELAQRSCFNLPSYACIREGPDHAPRFKVSVNFNGEMFESPTYFSTLRQAEHAAAEVALNTLAKRGPSKTLAAKVLDETGVYKNLLQETAHRAGLSLPVYTNVRSGPGHVPVFSCTVELAGMTFKGEPAKTKKQAQKSAAMSAWSALKQMSQRSSSCTSPTNSGCQEEQEQVAVARLLATLQPIESCKFTQSNQQKGHMKSCTSSTTFKRPSLSASSSFNVPLQNWASFNFSPNMALHHMWLQEQAAEQQRRLVTLAVPMPQRPPPRQFIPWMQSTLQPTHYPYCLSGEQQPLSVAPRIPFQTASSPVYFSNVAVPDPIKTRSMVTIQDIQEERTDATQPYLPEGDSPEIVMDEKLKKEGKQDSLSETNKLASAPEVKDNGSLDGEPNRCTNSGVQCSEAKLQNPHGVESSRNDIRLSHAPTASHNLNKGLAFPTSPQAAPVGSSQWSFRPPLTASRTRNGVGLYSMRPILGRMHTGNFPRPYMAPAVQIRSVVPVCSAAPPRRILTSSQETAPSPDVRDTSTGDVTTMSSNLENLRI